MIKLDFKSEIFELRRIAISHKGLGYGKESMIALLKYAFEERNVNRFWLDVYPDNVIGIKLYKGLGMHRDGVLRENYKSERGYLDQIIYSMLKREYFK
nr:GNAT family N-acetyltransferase [Clostridium sp.]